MDGVAASGGLAQVTELAAELGDLKRLHDAESPLSYAARAFRSAWGALADGAALHRVMLSATADMLAAVRLGGIDAALLARCGVMDGAAVLARSFEEVAGPVAPGLRAELRAALGHSRGVVAVPAFVDALVRQPRAGATCPGRRRIVLQPPESHADHCMVVAVLGVVLAPGYGADPAVVFGAGLAHHLHNAVLPDSGFAGEVLLGDALAPLMQRLFAQALATLEPEIADRLGRALSCIADASTPEGRAFHAADVIDRVLQMRHYEEVARFTTSQALDDLGLVHAGPVQAFHREVLSQAGLW